MSNENGNHEYEDDIETLNLEDTEHANQPEVRVEEHHQHSDTDISRQAKKNTITKKLFLFFLICWKCSGFTVNVKNFVTIMS